MTGVPVTIDLTEVSCFADGLICAALANNDDAMSVKYDC